MLISQGKPQFGTWQGEITSADLRQYRRGNWSDALLPLREKKWQYVGLYSQEFIIGLAIVDAGYVGNIFGYVYNRSSKVLWQIERVAPMAKGIRVDRSIHNAVCSYTSPTERMRFESHLALNKRSIDVRLFAEGQELDIRVELKDDIAEHPPLQTLMPTPDNDCTFTHKTAGLTALGNIRLGNQRWELTDYPTFAVIDTTIGYHARETFWNWASFAGCCNGHQVGLNLAQPTSAENAFWIDGKRYQIGPVHFSYNEKNPLEPWKITSEDGQIDLVFQGEGCRRQNLNYQIISSRFQQPFGYFSGTLHPKGHDPVKIDAITGVVEEHFAKW